MSGGKRIDDHKSWVGEPSKGSVFPEGVKVKNESSDGHEGAVSKYEDTTEAIRSQQEEGAGKMKKHGQKPGYRY